MPNDKRESPDQNEDTSVAPVKNLFVIGPHIEEHFGSDFFVLDEKLSQFVHVDVHVVRPNNERPLYTLLTSGMSDLPMKVPPGLESLAHAEVCLCLPATWPLSLEGNEWSKPEYFWPIGILKAVALYPHKHKTWLSWGHTISFASNGRAMDPHGRFCGVLIASPGHLPEGANELVSVDGEEITYLCVIPLLADELVFAQEHSGDELDEKLVAAGVTELLEPDRKSVL